jgi:uncharacterized protein YceH (UPF0502 family)
VDLRLNEYEVRTLGALVEKQISTPDYYPLTLNALISACNQKNNRQPAVSWDESTISRALDALREKNLAYVFYGSESRTAKYGHLFPKAFDLSPPEVAVLCVLMLRGPQTAGEIRSRSGYLHNFGSLDEVETILEGLVARETDPIVARLPRQPGTKEPRYAHLLSGEPPAVLIEAASDATAARAPSGERIAQLEAEVRALREELTALREQFMAFREQFG